MHKPHVDPISEQQLEKYHNIINKYISDVQIVKIVQQKQEKEKEENLSNDFSVLKDEKNIIELKK